MPSRRRRERADRENFIGGERKRARFSRRFFPRLLGRPLGVPSKRTRRGRAAINNILSGRSPRSRDRERIGEGFSRPIVGGIICVNWADAYNDIHAQGLQPASVPGGIIGAEYYVRESGRVTLPPSLLVPGNGDVALAHIRPIITNGPRGSKNGGRLATRQIRTYLFSIARYSPRREVLYLPRKGQGGGDRCVRNLEFSRYIKAPD